LSDDALREFREYSIPTVEISLDDDSSLDEVISLFVDINQQGVAVNRFDIVKAMYKGDLLMRSVFGLLALEQRRGQDIFYRPKRNEFTDVLKRLQVIENVPAPNSKVDRMWERLLELALFVRHKTHRKPVAILKEFITANKLKEHKLTSTEIKELRRVYRFLNSLRPQLAESRLFTDQVPSYTLTTSLLRTGLLDIEGDASVTKKLKTFARLLDKDAPAPTKAVADLLRAYRDLSAKQTTDVSRRQQRDQKFIEILAQL